MRKRKDTNHVTHLSYNTAIVVDNVWAISTPHDNCQLHDVILVIHTQLRHRNLLQRQRKAVSERGRERGKRGREGGWEGDEVCT